MEKLSRIECESAIMRKLKEIVEIYHQYDPDGDYLTMDMIHGNHLNVSNNPYESNKPLECRLELENDENIAIGWVFSDPNSEGHRSATHSIRFDIRDAHLVSEY